LPSELAADFAAFVETVHKRSLPAMWEIMKGTKYKPFYQNFLIAAGEAQGLVSW
jgi:hypothetical protein